MVSVVGRVPDARRRTGLNGARPLAERWQEGIDLLRRIAPETGFHEPISEFGLDRLFALIAQKQVEKAPPQPDSQTLAAAQEFWEFQRQWNSIALEIKQAQPWLERARTDWKHKLLKDISLDCFETPGLFDNSVGPCPFKNPTEAREASRTLMPHLQRLRRVLAAIDEARRFESFSADQQALALVRALIGRFTDFEARIAALEAHNMALEARMGRLERGKKCKKSKLRSKSSTRSANI
jgi:hypothetical protein